MKRASITEAKNRLSALLDRVRHGETILIEDRGLPVARLESVLARKEDAGHGRLARLERQGIVRRATGPLPKALLAARPPRPKGGARASALIVAERSESP